MRIVRRSPTVFAIFAIVVSAACGSDGSDVDNDAPEGGFKDTSSAYAGLAFTSVDRAYSSSTLWYNDLKTGNLKPVSTGESGDPWVAIVDGELLLFNRATGKLNVRVVEPVTETFGAQQALDAEEFQAGDPHAAFELASGNVLLALNVAGKLAVFDRTTGKTSVVAGDFDTGDGPFRPEAIVQAKSTAGTQVIYAVHQGLAADFKTPTGKSQVFVFEDDGKVVTAKDLDPATAKIQGIALKSTDPVAMYKSGDAVAVVGLCMPWIEGDCTAAIETIDPVTETASVVYDFTGAGYVGNGGVIGGKDGAFYASVTKGAEKQIVKVAPEQESIMAVHTFPQDSAGCCALYFDDSTAALYVGDFPADGNDGTLTRYAADGTSGSVTLQGRPYSGVPYAGQPVPK